VRNGATISVLMFALMVMAWQVGAISKRIGRAALPLVITLQLACAGLLVVGWFFFFGAPIVFSAGAAVLSRIAAITTARQPVAR
jgi:hypothetical protein